MKLDKAIEINDLLAKRLAHISQADEQAAVRLGIEALSVVKFTRSNNMRRALGLLPGETRE